MGPGVIVIYAPLCSFHLALSADAKHIVFLVYSLAVENTSEASFVCIIIKKLRHQVITFTAGPQSVVLDEENMPWVYYVWPCSALQKYFMTAVA